MHAESELGRIFVVSKGWMDADSSSSLGKILETNEIETCNEWGIGWVHLLDDKALVNFKDGLFGEEKMLLKFKLFCTEI